jgi:hypothetical protein
MSNGTSECRCARGILYINTKIGNSMLSTARSGFDAGRFKSVQARGRRHPVADAETGAVMSLVGFGDSRVRCRTPHYRSTGRRRAEHAG